MCDDMGDYVNNSNTRRINYRPSRKTCLLRALGLCKHLLTRLDMIHGFHQKMEKSCRANEVFRLLQTLPGVSNVNGADTYWLKSRLSWSWWLIERYSWLSIAKKKKSWITLLCTPGVWYMWYGGGYFSGRAPAHICILPNHGYHAVCTGTMLSLPKHQPNRTLYTTWYRVQYVLYQNPGFGLFFEKSQL